MAGLKALIPLDGSKLAEAALTTAPLLKALGVTHLQLVAVCEDLPDSGAQSAAYQEARDRGESAAGAYLRQRVRDASARGFEVGYKVRFGVAFEEVLAEGDNCKADLIVIATHGRAGPLRWRLGSVADKVVRLSEAPVLVVGPNVRSGRQRLNPRIVVPLDGSKLAEEALPIAQTIAHETGAALELVRVVTLPSVWTINPFTALDPLAGIELLEKDAKEYLAGVLEGVLFEGVDCGRTVLRAAFGSNVGNELNRHVAAVRASLVVMTSHARSGPARFVLGSVADEMLRGSTPVLMLKPDGRLKGALAQKQSERLETHA